MRTVVGWQPRAMTVGASTTVTVTRVDAVEHADAMQTLKLMAFDPAALYLVVNARPVPDDGEPPDAVHDHVRMNAGAAEDTNGEHCTVCPASTFVGLQPRERISGAGVTGTALTLMLARPSEHADPLQARSVIVFVPVPLYLVEKLRPAPDDGEPPEAVQE